MTSYKNLTLNQLTKMLSETQAELKRRDSLAKAQKEIEAVLKKYDLIMDDLNPRDKNVKISIKKAVSKNTTSKSTASKKDKRAVVSAKYKNPTSNDTWSGRGRAPSWVASICNIEKISIEKFKADQRFQV